MKDVGDISDIQLAIKTFFGDDIAAPSRIKLYRDDADDGGELIKKWSEIEKLDPKYFSEEDGWYISVRTSPPSSRESSAYSLASDRIWFQLVDKYGGPFKMSSVATVQRSECSDVNMLKDAIKKKNQDSLLGILSSQFIVFKDIAHFKNKDNEKYLKDSERIGADYGSSEDCPMIIIVPILDNSFQQLYAAHFDSRFMYDGKSKASSNRSEIKAKIVRDYFQISYDEFKNSPRITCQILGVQIFKFLVIGAHIFKREWAHDAPLLVGIDNVDKARNCLLLFKPIEEAFDTSRICFLKSTSTEEFELTILDPNLREETLLQSCMKFVDTGNCMKLEMTREQVVAELSEMLTIDGRLMTFGDLEGRHLICKGKSRPYKRCLNFHAVRARKYAMSQGWIENEMQIEFTWSPPSGDSGRMDRVREYIESLQTNTVQSRPAPSLGGNDDIKPEDAVDEQYVGTDDDDTDFDA